MEELFKLAVLVFLASCHITSDGHSLSLSSRLRHRLNNNCTSMLSFHLAIRALWTCYKASLFHPYHQDYRLKVTLLPTSSLASVKTHSCKWHVHLASQVMEKKKEKKIAGGIELKSYLGKKRPIQKIAEAVHRCTFWKGNNSSYNSPLWSRLKCKRHGTW